ncbi:MAG: OmpA family protein, partial [Muribaculaceae bacterium]|nr:OmpA family protein [Muribaculaceae bacterium]
DKKQGSQFSDGDSCNVSSNLSAEEHLIEDHPQTLIEDKYPADTTSSTATSTAAATAAGAAAVGGAAVAGAAAAAATSAPAPAPESEADEENVVDSTLGDPEAYTTAPVKRGSAWWAWGVAALAVVAIVCSWLYYSHKERARDLTENAVAYVTSARQVEGDSIGSGLASITEQTVTVTDSAGQAISGFYSQATAVVGNAANTAAGAVKSAGRAVKSAVTNGADAVASAVDSTSVGDGVQLAKADNYVYYFPNNGSAVESDNQVLDALADRLASDGSDVVITGYASPVGNAAYNESLSEARGENVADYLVAHGVDRSHIKVVTGGATDDYGSNPADRRVNIDVNA